MASDIKNKYGTTNQSIAITSFLSNANNAASASAAIDNRTNLFIDALVQCIITAPAASTSASGYVNVYAYGTADDGTTYSDSASGADGDITLTVPPNARLIGVINVVANGIVYESAPMSVAAAFGGILPAFWGIILENKTGGTMPASGCSAFYQGIQQQIV